MFRNLYLRVTQMHYKISLENALKMYEVYYNVLGLLKHTHIGHIHVDDHHKNQTNARHIVILVTLCSYNN